MVAAWLCVRDWWPLLGVGWFVAGCGSHRRGCSLDVGLSPLVRGGVVAGCRFVSGCDVVAAVIGAVLCRGRCSLPVSGRRVGGDKRARLLSRCGIVAAVSGCDVVAAALYLPAVAVVMW